MIQNAQLGMQSTPEAGWPGLVGSSGGGAAKDRAAFTAPPVRGLPAPGATLVARPRRGQFAGNPRQVRLARQFARRVLKGCAMADTAILLTNELVTNAILHTRSGRGGSFEVIVWRGRKSVCVAVRDDGSQKSPSLPGTNPHRESGRGLALVDALATRWGYEGNWAGRVVWFLLG